MDQSEARNRKVSTEPLYSATTRKVPYPSGESTIRNRFRNWQNCSLSNWKIIRPPQDVDVHAIFENPCSQPKTKTPSDDEKGENESHRGSGRRRQLSRPAGRPDVHLETFD